MSGDDWRLFVIVLLALEVFDLLSPAVSRLGRWTYRKISDRTSADPDGGAVDTLLAFQGGSTEVDAYDGPIPEARRRLDYQHGDVVELIRAMWPSDGPYATVGNDTCVAQRAADEIERLRSRGHQ
jgi:hypothetical protein